MGWVAMERVAFSDLQSWKEEKRSGPGRDPRILGVERDHTNHRWSTFRDSFVRMVMPVMASVGFGLQATSQVKETDWPFRGPLAILELLQAVRSSGQEIGAYHD